MNEIHEKIRKMHAEEWYMNAIALVEGMRNDAEEIIGATELRRLAEEARQRLLDPMGHEWPDTAPRFVHKRFADDVADMRSAVKQSCFAQAMHVELVDSVARECTREEMLTLLKILKLTPMGALRIACGELGMADVHELCARWNATHPEDAQIDWTVCTEEGNK